MQKRRALIFSGQGAQTVGMGADLLEHSRVVRHMFSQADDVLGFPLSQYCFEGPESKLTETAVCQPALYLHGLALLELTKEHIPNFRYEATAGLSLGEYTAHAAAGTFDFSTGLNLVFHRGRLMQEACNATHGGMLALVGATADQGREVAKESDLDASNFNAPGQVVLSGDLANIPKAIEIAKARGIRKAIPLKVAGAYHSRLMKTAQDGLRPYLDKASINNPPKPVMANVTGHAISDPAEIRQALSDQVCGSVLWENCIRSLIALGINEFVEFGPGGILCGMVKRIDPAVHTIAIGNYANWKENIHELGQ
jgi:[acyl-carrier-protein] S-malonyltransferase